MSGVDDGGESTAGVPPVREADPSWPDWYAPDWPDCHALYIVRERAGEDLPT